MNFLSLLLTLSISVSALAEYFDTNDLVVLPQDFTLVCGINHSDGTKQLIVYIKNGELVDYRGNVEFKNTSSGVGMLRGQVSGFADGQFILSEDFKSVKEGSSFQALDGCASSVENYHEENFIKSL